MSDGSPKMCYQRFNVIEKCLRVHNADNLSRRAAASLLWPPFCIGALEWAQLCFHQRVYSLLICISTRNPSMAATTEAAKRKSVVEAIDRVLFTVSTDCKLVAVFEYTATPLSCTLLPPPLPLPMPPSA